MSWTSLRTTKPMYCPTPTKEMIRAALEPETQVKFFDDPDAVVDGLMKLRPGRIVLTIGTPAESDGLLQVGTAILADEGRHIVSYTFTLDESSGEMSRSPAETFVP